MEEWAVTVGSGLSDAELVEVIAAAELGKRALAAVQVDATAALTASVRAADEAAGVRAAKRGRSVGLQVAAARRASPSSGNQHVGAARALVEELPHTLHALRTGFIEEWTATKVVQATTCLTREDRAQVDAALATVFTRDGIAGGQIAREAHAKRTRSAGVGAAGRPRRGGRPSPQAESERCVSLRHAPDTMAYVTALLPMVTAVAAHASLLEAVKEHAATRVEGDDRGRGAVMADTFSERLTGRVIHLEAQPVVVHLVMDTGTLLDAGEVSASIPGHGGVPASIARELLATAAEAGQAWVRRLFTAPDSSQLVAVESKQRAFPSGLGLFLTARDQRCATPYCDAPIRHLDHITPHARSGPTSAANGQGFCERCNDTKELPGSSSSRDPDTGITTLTTPTGHTYTSSPPPVLGHPVLPPAAVPIAATPRPAPAPTPAPDTSPTWAYLRHRSDLVA